METKTKQPNILFITADQWRWDTVGYMGNSHVHTPNLDSLARRGVYFENAFTPCPICVPARACIMTGNYPSTCTGVKNNGGTIKEGQPLFTELLKSVGYRTAAIGKLHFTPYSAPGKPRLLHGFEHAELTESGRALGKWDPQGELEGVEDYFDYLKSVGWPGFTRAHGIGNNDFRSAPSPLPQEHHVDGWIAQRTIAWLDRHQQEESERPFFLWMSSPKPHPPFDPPRPFDNLHDPRELPAPFGTPEDLLDRNPALEETRIQHAIPSLSPMAIQVMRSYYYGSIAFLDTMIGKVLNHLDKLGLKDETLIVFTADHGEMLGDFGTVCKSNHLNGSVRVPFLACGPGVEPGQRADDLVGLQDLLPTFAEAAGVGDIPDVHGQSLFPRFGGGPGPVRELYYAQVGDSPKQSSMVTDGRTKYIYSEANATEELYDLIDDPCELRNLAGDPAQSERLKEWRGNLCTEAKRYHDQQLFEGGDLKRSEWDREQVRQARVGGALGWRWY